jgi:Secretion system C-terminal sorting domain/SprB repeat
MRSIQYLNLRVFCITLCTIFSLTLMAQGNGNGNNGNGNGNSPCNAINASIFTSESRCKATGVVTIFAFGGSGQYNYRVRGPVNTSYTSSIIISGLQAGTYFVDVRDIVSNCVKTFNNVVVSGTYIDPRFSLTATNVTCKNASDGSLTVNSQTGGRGPFIFRIVNAPAPGLIGVSNSTGSFSNLPAGDYSVQMEDSCSNIQTRRVTILPYDWWINTSGGTLTNCGVASLFVNLRDNKGNNTPNALFNSFQYGWVRGTADTVWGASNTFTANIGTRRSVMLVARDGCGNRASVAWAVNPVPAITAAVQTALTSCNAFSATVTGQSNLTSPQYCLFNSSNVQLSCNTTGQFTGLPGGSYTVAVRDVCYDTTIIVPFTVVQPVPNITGQITYNRTSCTTFDAQVNGLVNFENPEFCVYRNSVQLACNFTGNFTGLTNGSYEFRVKDGCYDTTIIRTLRVDPLIPSVSTSPAPSNYLCTTFDVAITGQTNLNNPVYTLRQGATVIATNTTGTFGAVTYGTYCIDVKNDPLCYDTTITVCFTGAKIPPSVNESIAIVRRCNSVNLTVTGQTQIYNPEYCVFDVNNQQVICNTDGVFTDLPYGTYCIQIKNDPACYDTTIIRCLTVAKLIPELGGVSISQSECLGFTASITGAANLNDPVYTLKDLLGNVLGTNTTGSFSNIPYGSYCMEMQNNPLCYDTLIVRCFSAERPKPSGGVVTASSLTCPGFTATVSGLVNFNNPTFTLKDNGGNVVSTNSTGIFNVLGYGNYCIDVKNDPLCYDTTITVCVNPIRPTPSVGGVTTGNLTCTGFDATVTGQNLLTNPTYNILNASNAVVASNTTGTFSNVPYGSYTMQVIDGCYETPFLIPFSATRPPLNVSATPAASCFMGNTNIVITVNSGMGPFIATAYDPLNNVAGTVNTSSSTINLNDLPGLAPGMEYRVEVIDACGFTSSLMVTPVLSTINKTIQIVPQCPTGTLPDGSSDVVLNVTSNLGVLVPTIVSQNGSSANIPFSIQAGNTFTWYALGPATYIVRYDLPGGCANKLYDTVIVSPYEYPSMANSAVYQCSNNSFSVSTEMLGGSAPYQYQIIASSPTSPSINTGWQNSPIFTINNGSSYSLVRMRAIDACGNSSLSDASVLPLENVLVSSSSTCMFTSITMDASYVANSEYTWYKKTSPTDSVEVGTGISYTIPYLTPADTGTYVARISVNNGCLTTASYFNLTGICNILPATSINLTGKKSGTAADLTWNVRGEKNIKEYIIERTSNQASGFKVIGKMNGKTPAGDNSYQLVDGNPAIGVNFYRVKAVDIDGKFMYSNTVSLNWVSNKIVIYPVPARDVVNVMISSSQSQDLRIQLYTMSGQLLQEKVVQRVQQATVPIYRKNMAAGMYLIRITDTKSGAVQTDKIIFE